MKKTLFILTALLAVVFTGCKVEKSEVTVYVADTEGNPMKNREILYTDMVSLILDVALPSPESLVTGIPEGWEYATANNQGVVTIPFDMSVSTCTISAFIPCNVADKVSVNIYTPVIIFCKNNPD